MIVGLLFAPGTNLVSFMSKGVSMPELQPKEILVGPSIRLSVPQWFEDPEFVAFLKERAGHGLATWHKVGESCPDEFSDVFVGVDPSLTGEGTDLDMPEKFWDEIVRVCQDVNPFNPHRLHIMVHLSPV